MDFSFPFAANALPNFLSNPPAEGGLREWILKGTYRIAPLQDGCALLDIDDSEFTPYLLFDYSRSAFASLESLAASYQTYFDSKALAWPHIKRYYAGFFAAHAIARSQGRGVIRLEGFQATHLSSLIRATHGASDAINAGTFEFEFISSAPRSSFLKLIGRKKTSVHEDFWSYFETFLDDFAASLVESNNASATEFLNKYLELKKLLCVPQRKGRNGLSAFRNSINYQQLYGVWYPFRRTQMVDAAQKKGRALGPQSQILHQNNSALSLAHDPVSAPLSAFLTAVCFIARVNIDLVTQLRGRYRSGSQFFKEWDKLSGLLN